MVRLPVLETGDGDVLADADAERALPREVGVRLAVDSFVDDGVAVVVENRPRAPGSVGAARGGDQAVGTTIRLGARKRAFTSFASLRASSRG